jgi:hypothetical protein
MLFFGFRVVNRSVNTRTAGIGIILPPIDHLVKLKETQPGTEYQVCNPDSAEATELG